MNQESLDSSSIGMGDVDWGIGVDLYEVSQRFVNPES